MVDDRAVGLFTAGMKLTYLIRIFVTSLGAVMLPRCSHLIGENKIEEFNAVITKSYHFLMFMAIPMTFGIILLARPITLCFCGADFMGAVAVVIITAPTIILIGQTNIIGIQILYPFGKVNTVIYSTLLAAIINVVLNILLIPSLKEVGAAISTLATEFSVLLFQLHYGKKYIPFALFEKQIVRYLITSVITAVCISLCFLLENVWWQLAAGSIIGISIYLIILHIGKDPVYKEIVGLFLNRIFLKKEGWS
jgi:O-antigen/teichoic acid export membrane protein